MVDRFKIQIDKIQEEIEYCNSGVTPMLVKTSLVLGHELENGEVTSLEYEEKMEKVTELSKKFSDECSCMKTQEMMNLIMPNPKKKKK